MCLNQSFRLGLKSSVADHIEALRLIDPHKYRTPSVISYLL